jgi:hypothetical protein
VIVIPAAAMSHLPGVHRLAGLDGLERGVHDLLLDAELLGDQIHEIDVEAHDLAVLLVLERLVREVGAHGQCSLLDQLRATLGGRRARVGGAAGECQGSGAGDGKSLDPTDVHGRHPHHPGPRAVDPTRGRTHAA